MRTKKVAVVKYDSAWTEAFEKIAEEILSVLGSLAVRIEHVGSTSVPGLSAKPVIDMDIVIRDETVLQETISALQDIGYVHEGDLGIKGREAFRYERKDHLMKHHLYVCPADSPELRRHIAFRDYLLSHPDAVREYGSIKEEAARLYSDDIDGYIRYKSPFIERIYEAINR
ncbi:MAG: GrpB family protein [Clostridia bacterium]|jgi:GrpB-like predicted nucleotidyltransferase (UPF0157 family)|nr:GrpB family protein [Clostridia bacterium]